MQLSKAHLGSTTLSSASHNVLKLSLFLLGLVLAGCPSEAFMEKPQFKSYLVELIGTREGWPQNMTEDEQRIMSEHFHYLQELTLKGKVQMAGPVFGQFGMIVLKVSGEEEARQIMDVEPSVVQGVHTYKLYEMVNSLMASHVFPKRYPEQQSDRELVKEVTVKCSLADAWRRWTTNDGAHTFFSANTNIDLRPGGPYEIYFNMDAPYGERGSEDCKILSYLQQRMLSFEWNAPPQFDLLRYVKTRVVLTFEPVGDDSTKVTLHHVGWGADPAWDEIYDYFDRAWDFVMDNFEKAIAEKN